ncbi:MAG: Holliday junction branch migration protein RuvA [Clostridia bacterium]
MFAYMKGTLEVKTLGYVVIEVAGIGYKVFMSEPAIEKLGEIGEIVKVHTYLRVREDDISVYGFNTNEELRMFELLLSVSGVGAKSAIMILANITPSSFALAIISNDVAKLKQLPGIGAKTAQRLILELKDKLKNEEMQDEVGEQLQESFINNEVYKETVSALQVLGYSKKEIEKALEKVDKESISVEDMIRKALTNLAR